VEIDGTSHRRSAQQPGEGLWRHDLLLVGVEVDFPSAVLALEFVVFGGLDPELGIWEVERPPQQVVNLGSTQAADQRDE